MWQTDEWELLILLYSKELIFITLSSYILHFGRMELVKTDSCFNCLILISV